jgi:hypothetical protein
MLIGMKRIIGPELRSARYFYESLLDRQPTSLSSEVAILLHFNHFHWQLKTKLYRGFGDGRDMILADISCVSTT